MAALTKRRLYAIRQALQELVKSGAIWSPQGLYGKKDVEAAMDWANEKIADKERATGAG